MKNYKMEIKIGSEINSWILKWGIFTLLIIIVSAAKAQPEQAIAKGLMNRLIEIKYTSELYLTIELGNSKNDHNFSKEKLDSALALYNTLRWKMDGFVYQLSADMITSNSPRRMRLLNDWCLKVPTSLNNLNGRNKKIANYVNSLNEIAVLFQDKLMSHLYKKTKTLNLTTNVFYLLKDSYTIINGLNDMKTQKTMALVELLDNSRLLSPVEVGKMGK